MSITQLNNKKEELEWWLRNNPNHPNRVTVEGDLREVNYQLAEKEKDS